MKRTCKTIVTIEKQNENTKVNMVVSIDRGAQYRPQNTLIIGNPKRHPYFWEALSPKPKTIVIIITLITTFSKKLKVEIVVIPENRECEQQK